MTNVYTKLKALTAATVTSTAKELRMNERFKAAQAPAVETGRMTFTIEEHIEYEYGHYMTIGFEECAVCTVPFLDICNEDPGSHEAAVGVRYVCEHPGCREITGAGMLICGMDIEELLEKDSNEIYELAEANNGVLECDGEKVDLWAIVARRNEVEEYIQDTMPWLFAWDGGQYDEHEEDDVDLETEKWNNYWGDYNQCGIQIDWHR